MNKTYQKADEKTIEKIIKLWTETDLSVREISKKCNIPKSTVYHILHNYLPCKACPYRKVVINKRR